MNCRTLTAIFILITSSLVTPVKAQVQNNHETKTLTQVQNACINNKAETLPNPFSDVSPDHWAFKAVITMHYCGAFRQATPPALFERLQDNQSEQKTKPQKTSPSTNN